MAKSPSIQLNFLHPSSSTLERKDAKAETQRNRLFLMNLTVLSASQEISQVLWNQKAHCHVYNSQPVVLILSQINPNDTIQHYFHDKF
jgi:hypothetical protein